MNLHQFLLALRGRLWVFVSLLAATVVGAIVVTLLMPKTYEASAALLVDNRDEQSLSGTMPNPRDRVGFMQTQVDIINSMEVARRVVQSLKLAEDPQARAQFQATGAHGTLEDWLAQGMLSGLKVNSSQSSVITLTYSAHDPKFAARAANAFAQAYMDMTLALRVDPTRQAASWFEEQLKGLRKSFEEAQARLAKYQREKGIIATDERIDVENARLNELSTQALQAQASTFESQSRSGMAARSSNPETLPEVLGNPIIQSLKTEVLRGEAKLKELSLRLGPNHPQYQQQQAEVSSLRQKMNDEMHRVMAGVTNVTTQNQARQGALQAALEQQRRRVMELRDARSESLVLQRDVDTAQKAYEAALQRYLVNKVESGVRQTNVTTLNQATEPTRHSKPKTMLNILLGVFVGIVLGLGAVFLLELLDRRVRSADDLETGLDVPLLATLQPWRPSPLLGGPALNGGRALPSPA
ncbi:MAG TPA: chain length determinant protein EpsF [Usitatibacter sp.]|nr:chain length determinant protein EpsF [Usitatibacter sp.]